MIFGDKVFENMKLAQELLTRCQNAILLRRSQTQYLQPIQRIQELEEKLEIAIIHFDELAKLHYALARKHEMLITRLQFAGVGLVEP